MLVAMEDRDHVVGLDSREQGVSLRLAPPVWCAAAGIVEGPPGRIPALDRERVPAVVLEQDHRSAVRRICGKVVLEPRQAVDRPLAGVAGELVGLDQMNPAPVPGVVVGGHVIARDRHRRLEEHAAAMIELDIVAQLAAVPVDMRRRAVLVEVVVAEAAVDREMHAVRAGALLVALAELPELRAFARHRHLPAAVVGHVPADHDAERRGYPGPGADQPGRHPPDLVRPDVGRHVVDPGDVAEQIGVGLALLRAVRTEAIAHTAGVHVVGEDEGRIESRRRLGRLRPGTRRNDQARAASQSRER